jgi:hypothetical protein
MSSELSELALELVRRDAHACVLAVSGDLSLCSTGLVTRAVSKALLDVGRVLVDVSGLRLTRVRVAETVPLASNEAAARRLLGRRPPAVARYLDLNEGEGLSLPRRARLFVKAINSAVERHHGLFLVAAISRTWGPIRPRTARVCGHSCRSQTPVTTATHHPPGEVAQCRRILPILPLCWFAAPPGRRPTP